MRGLRPPSARRSTTSADVSSTPAHMGMPVSRFSATADPMTSARSVATMASSAATVERREGGEAGLR